jgi:hypothetical protein
MIAASPKGDRAGQITLTENPMNPGHVLAVHDYRDLMHSLGVVQSATDFACPKCGARSFMVLRACPMEVECLKCNTVALFSVAAVSHEPDVAHLNAPPRPLPRLGL